MNTLRCDILILGAGPAGMAALSAAACDKQVIILDDNPPRRTNLACGSAGDATGPPGATATPSPRQPPSG